MPIAPPSACPCGGLRRNGRCDRCSNKDSRPSAKARGYGTSWDKSKESYLRRNPFCVCCLAQGRYNSKRGRTGLRVDHIAPQSLAPERFWDEANWNTICLECDLRFKQPIEKRCASAEQVEREWSELLTRMREESVVCAK